MWQLKCSLVVVAVLLCGRLATATWCYQCDTWSHRDCGDYEELNRDFLIQCSPPGQLTPTSCRKEVTTFLPPADGPAIPDPYNRFNRPHIMRRCGVSLLQSYQNQNQNQQYHTDRCYEEESYVDGRRALRRICTCSDDECNSAMSSRQAVLTTLCSTMIFWFVISKVLL